MSDTIQNMQWQFRALQWGRVKGELRTMADLLGAVSPDFDTPQEEKQYERFSNAAEAFIKQIEDEGLHE